MSLLIAFYILGALAVLVLAAAAAALLIIASRAADWTRLYLGLDIYPDWIIDEHRREGRACD